MTEQILDFDYEAYERQLDNLIRMSEVFAYEQQDCTTQELTLDILSLQAKTRHLCTLVDTDYAIQMAELIHRRQNQNTHYCKQFAELLCQLITPLLKNVINEIRVHGTYEGRKSQASSPAVSAFLPKLIEVMEADGIADWNMTIHDIKDVENLMAKKMHPTVLPGMRFHERVWRLLQYYVQLCYIYFHFHRTTLACNRIIELPDAGRVLTSLLQNYTQSEEGSKELQRFEAVLLYKNDGKPLTVEQLTAARKSLLSEVPTPYQLCYMQHIQDIDRMAHEVMNIDENETVFYQFLETIAKWQLLTAKINEFNKPTNAKTAIYNEVFIEELHGKPIDLQDIREGIKRLLPFISRKNHWFCVWAVLKHRNLLRTMEFEAFARQMMHKDWFRSITPEKHFTGDTLREYAGYFTNIDFTIWSSTDFLLYKSNFHKSRWSDTLSDKFQRLCYTMDEEFS